MSHIHDKIDFTAEAMIVFNDKVLLRMHDKYKQWFGVGGHIELDEDPIQAVIRECKEEVGLDVRIIPEPVIKLSLPTERELTPPAFMNRHKIGENHEHINMLFFAVAESDKVVDEGVEKSFGTKWFSEQELVDPQYGVSHKVIEYAKAALTAVRSIPS